MNEKRQWRDEVACFLATTLYTGYFPVAPGTVGAAAAVLLLWFAGMDQGFPLLGLALLTTLIGVWAAGRVEALWQETDPGRVNLDEVAGMMVSLLFLPRTGVVFILAFVAFRVFDILKPVPVSTAERLPHGWGIMADDIVAGIYANIVLQLVVYFRLF
ncbi:MAG TPA: phosphatidylglycerophosphatase A [bacterium]|nr:phosphatidylglycerophosphatase A [bacterium]